MREEVELSMIDLRYESYRMRNSVQEARVLASMGERGIEEPVEGVQEGERRILLNGFKRYRCAKKLGMGFLPFDSLGEDEATGILAILRISNNKALGILEQARFIQDLKERHQMNIAQIGETLSRSKSWVSMRVALLREMGAKVRDKIFSGGFPVYAYMYTLRQFMRMNGVKKQEVEEFVEAVSGKKLSIREIEQLAHGYFRGPASIREQVQNGNLALPLEWIKTVPQNAEGVNEFERVLLKDLLIVQKYMQRITGKSHNDRLKTKVFCAEANLLTAGILSRLEPFRQTLRKLHDRTGQA